MNQSDASHAGNFADVFKHVMLVRIIEYLKRKDKPFRVFMTHTGRGSYKLASRESSDSSEWKLGLERVINARMQENVESLIQPWKDIVLAQPKGTYPGAARIAHGLLRKSDRLTLYEVHPEDHSELAREFARDYQTRIYPTDGWTVSVSPIPPKEGRGLIFVDPPYQDGKDFDRMIKLLNNSGQRWAGGVAAMYYPVKRRDHTDEWLNTLRSLKYRDLLNVEMYIRDPRSPAALNGCGMVVLNPPYVLRNESQSILPALCQSLKQDQGAGYRIQDLSAG